MNFNEEEEEDYLFMTPPCATRMRTSHSSVSSEVGLTASPLSKPFDPTVLCRVVHQLGVVDATNVLDSPCDIADVDHLASSFDAQLRSLGANTIKSLYYRTMVCSGYAILCQ